jgi:hypothetical protein
VPRRRAVAVRLTRWLRARGVPAGNVVVHFADHVPSTVFSGAMPIEALGTDTADLRHASVVCQVGPDRDEDFRAELADELAEALGAGEGTGFLYVEFRPTAPDHVHVWRGNGLRRADLPPEPTTPDLDQTRRTTS